MTDLMFCSINGNIALTSEYAAQFVVPKNITYELSVQTSYVTKNSILWSRDVKVLQA